MSGSNCRPDEVGEDPLTICRKSGRYVVAPKSAMPTMKPIAADTVKTRLENRRSGSTGSGARRSIGMSSAVASTERAPRPMICHDPHGYVAPPRLVASTKQAAATLSRIVPRTSMRTSRWWAGTSSTIAMTTSATIPTGTLT